MWNDVTVKTGDLEGEALYEEPHWLQRPVTKGYLKR